MEEAEAVRNFEVAIMELVKVKLDELPEAMQDGVERILAAGGKLTLAVTLPSRAVMCSCVRDGIFAEVFHIDGDPARRFFPPVPVDAN